MVPSTFPQTTGRIPAVYAVPVTTDTGLTHLVGDDVYTVTMVMLGQRPFTALCGTQVVHGSVTTRPCATCENCTAICVRFGLRYSVRRVADAPSVGPRR
jgi:hypothetical protein